MPWLVRHASSAINLGQLGLDGLTPWERIRIRKYQKLMLPNRKVPIVETVMFHTGAAPSRHEGRWQLGNFIGLADRNEFYCGVEGKVATARTVRRLPPSENANRELLGKMQGTPWAMAANAWRDSPGTWRHQWRARGGSC
eukprot:2487110-Amphidinium_carterae.3